MFKRRTSKVRQRRQVRVLRASVMSPRIFWCDFRKAIVSVVKLCFYLALIGAAGWGIWRGVEHGLLENEEFQLQRLELNENPAMDEIRFLNLTEINLEGSLFDCDPALIEAKIESLPEMAGARVSRDFPGTLNVDVVVRKPFVWVACESQGVMPRSLESGLLVDRKGVLFPCTPGMQEVADGLPVIVLGEGNVALEAGSPIDHPDYVRGLRLYSAALVADPNSCEWIDRICQHKEWGSKLTTRKNLEATFGHREIERQMADLLAAMEHAREKGDRIAAITLVGKRNLPVKFHEISPPKAIPVPEPEPETRGDSDLRHLLER